MSRLHFWWLWCCPRHPLCYLDNLQHALLRGRYWRRLCDAHDKIITGGDW